MKARRLLTQASFVVLGTAGCQLFLDDGEPRAKNDPGNGLLPTGGNASAVAGSDGEGGRAGVSGSSGLAGSVGLGGTLTAAGNSGGSGLAGGSGKSAGGSDAAGSGGSNPQELGCDEAEEFQTPHVMQEFPDNSTQNVWAARFSSDGLRAYFTLGGTSEFSELNGFADLYVMSRSDPESPFGEAHLLPLSEPEDVVDANASETADGHTLYFDSSRPLRRIWRANRKNTSDDYSDPEELTALAIGYESFEPYVLPDHSAIYFVVSNPFVQTPKVYEILWAGIENGKISEPEKLQIGSFGGNERAPVMSLDKRELYFASDEGNTSGQYDIWFSKRASANEPFPAPKKAFKLSSSVPDFPSDISGDRCEIYLYSRNVKGSQNAFKVMRARRPPKFK